MSKKLGRPAVNDPSMSKRFNVRCSDADFAAWERAAKKRGIPTVGAYLRHLANVDGGR